MFFKVILYIIIFIISIITTVIVIGSIAGCMGATDKWKDDDNDN